MRQLRHVQVVEAHQPPPVARQRRAELGLALRSVPFPTTAAFPSVVLEFDHMTQEEY